MQIPVLRVPLQTGIKTGQLAAEYLLRLTMCTVDDLIIVQRGVMRYTITTWRKSSCIDIIRSQQEISGVSFIVNFHFKNNNNIQETPIKLRFKDIVKHMCDLCKLPFITPNQSNDFIIKE